MGDRAGLGGLRQWGAAQCGRFAAAAGCVDVGTLLTGPSISSASAGTQSPRRAARRLSLRKSDHRHRRLLRAGPMALGAGRSHATSARIVSEAVFRAAGPTAERNAFAHRVVAADVVCYLFTFGSKRGAIGLPLLRDLGLAGVVGVTGGDDRR